MNDRRSFLRKVSALAASGFGGVALSDSCQAVGKAADVAVPGELPEYLGWKRHWMKQGDGQGGWVVRPAQMQFLHWKQVEREDRARRTYVPLPYHSPDFRAFCSMGVVQMDNGEVALMGDVDHGFYGGGRPERPAIAFSRDGGNSWTDLKIIADNVTGRPGSMEYLGNGEVAFSANWVEGGKQVTCRFFSRDFGRTWPERVPLPIMPIGHPLGTAGNRLIDRDPNGAATRISTFVWVGPEKATYSFPESGRVGGVASSYDGGRTWSTPITPEEWVWEEEFQGKTYKRGVVEGSLIRAANGWLVAALRTDMPARYIPLKNDNAEGIGISISKDDGKTWSPLKTVFTSGRMHAHLLRMPDGMLVMTYIMRQDIEEGRLASYRRGSGAVVSVDHGLTWDVSRQYLLDDFAFADRTPLALACGHNYSALLSDGHILTAYGHYPSKGAGLVRWKPSAGA